MADDELRRLARQAQSEGPEAVRHLARVLQRSGQLHLDPLLDELRAAEQRLVAARSAYVETLVAAFRHYLPAVFHTHPTLDALILDWRLERSAAAPWTVAFQLTHTGHFMSHEEQVAVECDLLRYFSPLLPSQRRTFGQRRYQRTGEALRVLEDEDTPDPRQLSGVHEIAFRLVEDLAPALHSRRADYDAGTRLLVASRDAAASVALAAGAERDLEDAQRTFLNHGEGLWGLIVPALFHSIPGLRACLIVGYVAGYNDNWYDEHDQTVFLDGADLRDGFGRPLPERWIRAIEGENDCGWGTPAFQRAREALRHLLTWLRARHGPRFALFLHADGSEESEPHDFDSGM